MANLQGTAITGSFVIGTTTGNTSAVGNFWFDTSTNTLYYSTLVGGNIVSRSINLG